MTEGAGVESGFLEVWAESAASVLGQIAGSPVSACALHESPPGLPAVSEADLWLVGALSGGLRGEMSMRLAAASAVRLAQMLMGEAPSGGSEATAEHREGALELLRQVAGTAATALGPRWGEVQIRLEAAPGAPSWGVSFTGWIRGGTDEATAPVIEIQLSAALVAALRAAKQEILQPAATPPSGPEPAVTNEKGKLDLLMDVELGLTLRFGSRRLLLREILDLNPGAVIELDRQVEQPVDVLLDGRLVARGEVVVIEGNYGLKVTEVAPSAGL